MVKKFLMVSVLIVVASFCMTYVTFPRGGGDAFAGSLGGSLLGSAIGTSIASRPCSSSGSSDGRALRAVDRLEDIMRRDLATLNNKIAKLEKRLEKLESYKRKEKRATVIERDVAAPTTATKNVVRKKIVVDDE